LTSKANCQQQPKQSRLQTTATAKDTDTDTDTDTDKDTNEHVNTVCQTKLDKQSKYKN